MRFRRSRSLSGGRDAGPGVTATVFGIGIVSLFQSWATISTGQLYFWNRMGVDPVELTGSFAWAVPTFFVVVTLICAAYMLKHLRLMNDIERRMDRRLKRYR